MDIGKDQGASLYLSFSVTSSKLENQRKKAKMTSKLHKSAYPVLGKHRGIPNISKSRSQQNLSNTVLGFFYIKPIEIFLLRFPKNVQDQSGPYINTFQTNIRNFCLSVILKFCLSSSIIVCCHLASSVVVCLCPRSSLHQLMQKSGIFTKSQVYYRS